MQSAPRPATRDEVPVLDLTALNRGESLAGLAREMRRACETIGFFYVANHGVPGEVVDELFDVTRRYFSIPEEQRMPHRMDDRFRRGFVPQGIYKHPGYQPDLKEGYTFSLDLPLDDPDVQAGRLLHGPNRWPEELPWFRPPAERYFHETLELGKRLLRVLALSLDLDEGFFLQYMKKPMAQTMLFHYSQQAVPSDAQFGVAPHTDYGMLTLLTQDPIGGLELQKRDGGWVSAPWIENTFVVNLGDLIKIWTNDVYVSNLHRVVNRTGRERYSIPTFINMDYDTPVACVPSCRPAVGEPKYPPIKSGDYLVSRFKAVQGLDKKVDERLQQEKGTAPATGAY